LDSGGYLLLFTSANGDVNDTESTAFDVDEVILLSDAFNSTIGGGAGLAVVVQPGNGTSDAALSVQPAVAVVSVGGLGVADDFGTVVTVSLVAGTGSEGAVLEGNRTAVSSGGVATFTDLRVRRAGVGYRLLFVSPGLNFTESEGFDVGCGVAVVVSVLVQPGNGSVGSPLFPQPAVAVADQAGNLVAGAMVVTAELVQADANGSGVRLRLGIWQSRVLSVLRRSRMWLCLRRVWGIGFGFQRGCCRLLKASCLTFWKSRFCPRCSMRVLVFLLRCALRFILGMGRWGCRWCLSPWCTLSMFMAVWWCRTRRRW